MFTVAHSVDFFDMVGQTAWNLSLQRTLLHWMGLNDNHYVLDAGCGAGRFTSLLAARVRWVTGLDIDAAMVERASAIASDYALTNTTFVQGSVHQLPFTNDTFDIVVCVNVLPFIQRRESACEELLRVLKSTGHLIVLNPSDDMNPWAVEKYCSDLQLKDFERDSIQSWALALSRVTSLSEADFERMITSNSGKILGKMKLLDDLAVVYRICR